MSFLFDTNVLSEVRRPKPEPRVLAWIGSLAETEIHLSVATVAELKRGIMLMAQGRRREALSDWLDHDVPSRLGSRLLPITSATCEIWGDVAATCLRRGHNIDTIDAFIAAAAIEHGLVLATRNIKDFKFAKVELFNPWED